MKLATIRTPTGTAAVRVEDDHAVELGEPDLGALLRHEDWLDRATVDGPTHAVSDLDFAPVVPSPEKILCVGLNYRRHILEMGRELPKFPTLFAKFPPALIGAYDDIVLPEVSDAMDWEAELALVTGPGGTIAGYTVLNDVTARDWQYRTAQWLQGKTFARTTPVGPYLVTGDLAPAQLSCEVNGELMQSASTSDLVFGPAELIEYISTILPLAPGDLIATGTPGGVGHARKPPVRLGDGDLVTTRIEGLGECHNRCRAEKPS
ncbi:fumarylacetoacetate hydrolase family protein [Amycolatopsis sp. FDAARGOS 1241]|uniref:fumarylacetoacetate hydrolase family protein n=1 Tax=Amycolatopsis sp. FDAARGOS 1241 TaxID=2778070 RepID=UPI0019525958|nr:fumarylacetoacetate hydrolase family protein [Amycolatopsis sp. FDAARGOS 1241]QRP49073.1 fumarylacetoacetate hydrolase family protein [Amycolatopsis sp. FDAARGOS 1241]